MLHFWHFIIAPKKLKLDFNMFQEKQLPKNESTTNSWEFWCLCVFVRGSPIFTENAFKFIVKLNYRRIYYQYPNLWVFLSVRNLFVKKNKQTWNRLDSLNSLYHWVKNLLVIFAGFFGVSREIFRWLLLMFLTLVAEC